MTCRSLNLNMCCLWWATSAFELSIWGVPFRSRSSESEKFPYQMIQNLAMILILMFDGLLDVGWTERNADGSQLWEPFMLADEHQPIKAWLKGHAEDNIIVTKWKPYPTRHVTYYIYTSCLWVVNKQNKHCDFWIRRMFKAMKEKSACKYFLKADSG